MNATPGRFAGTRILIVDDDPDVLESTSLAFAAEGAEVDLAADGNEAVARFEERRPDGVVLDMMLPARSGFLVLEKIRETSSNLPVVMVTANQGHRHLDFARGLGVSAYLVKPVPLTEIMDVLSQLLATPET